MVNFDRLNFRKIKDHAYHMKQPSKSQGGSKSH